MFRHVASTVRAEGDEHISVYREHNFRSAAFPEKNLYWLHKYLSCDSLVEFEAEYSGHLWLHLGAPAFTIADVNKFTNQKYKM